MLPFYENLTERLTISRGDVGSFPAHLHRQIEMLYVLSGSPKMTIDDRCYPLARGALALVFPHVVHSYEPHEPADTIMMICPAEWAGDFSRTLQREAPRRPVIDAPHPDVDHALRALLAEPDASPALGKTLTQLILVRSLPLLSLAKRAGARDNDRIFQVIEHVSEHFHEPLTLDQLARHVGVSRYHLSRLFREKLHTSFSEYLNSFRVDTAKNLLRTSDMDILQVCFAAGFESQRSFNRVFRAQLGVSPSAYRSQQ